MAEGPCGALGDCIPLSPGRGEGTLVTGQGRGEGLGGVHKNSLGSWVTLACRW